MPLIQISSSRFFGLLCDSAAEAKRDINSLETDLAAAKARVREFRSGVADSESLLSIEVNDENRPDLWSAAGLARQLNSYRKGRLPLYSFFSTEAEMRPTESIIRYSARKTDSHTQLAACRVCGKNMEKSAATDLSAFSSLVSAEYGLQWGGCSIRVHRLDGVVWPMDETALVESLVPSAEDCADFLVCVYGDDLSVAGLLVNIIACDLADDGHRIVPVRIEYATDTIYGRNPVFPLYFQLPATVDAAKASRLLGESLSPELIQAALFRMGLAGDIHGQYVRVLPPPYRNDFLHQVDLIEDIMLGLGLDNFEPDGLSTHSEGSLEPLESLGRLAREHCIGFGFREVVTPLLGSLADYAERMRLDEAGIVRLQEKQSAALAVVRPSLIPGLLGVLAKTGVGQAGVKLFEYGKLAYADADSCLGSNTRQRLAYLISRLDARLEDGLAVLDSLFSYLGLEYSLSATEDVRFCTGRQQAVAVSGAVIATIGEVSTAVLANWGLQFPVVTCELDVAVLLDEVRHAL